MVLIGKAYRATIAWQSMATLAVAVVSALLSGKEGFLSALLGGGVGIAGVLVYALASTRKKTLSPIGVVRSIIRAEAAKIITIVLLLWLVFSVFHGQMKPLAFIGAFIVSVVLSGLTFAMAE